MTGKWITWVGAAALSASLLCSTGSSAAQSGQQQPPPTQAQPTQQQPPQPDKDKPNPAPLSMDKEPVPVTPEEETAYKAVQSATDVSKKLQMAEEFLQKYPQSRYRPAMYQALVSG
jgi:TolA-binding protein